MSRDKYGVPEDFEYALAEALEGLEVGEYGINARASTFTDQGMMTMNAGVTLELDNGLEVQLTINHSGGIWPGEDE
jgi:hypothetical protein